MSYQIAKDLLSQTEKDRLLCALLNCPTTPKPDFQAAAKDFGSASGASFYNMYNASMKKITAASNKRSAEGEEPKEAPKTPKKTPRKTKPKKDNNIEADDDDEVKTPVKSEPED